MLAVPKTLITLFLQKKAHLGQCLIAVCVAKLVGACPHARDPQTYARVSC